MRITVTARHMELPDFAKEYAAAKAERLGRFYDHLRKIEIVLDAAKDRRHGAELIVSAARGQVLVCHATGTNATSAIDLVMDKMERRLTKFKEKLRKNHPPKEGPLARTGRRSDAEGGGAAEFSDLWW